MSISQRDEIVKERVEFGHWEGDSVIYPNKKAINTMNELKTGLVAFTVLERKTSELTTRAMINNLLQHMFKTLTLDNGTEFTRHEEVSEAKRGFSIFLSPIF